LITRAAGHGKVPPAKLSGNVPSLVRSATDAWLDLVWRRHRLVLAVAALFTLACTALAMRLDLRTNVAELLPSKDPAVEELQNLAKRIGGTSILQIAIESPDRDANLKLAGALTQKLRALPRDTIESAVYDVRAERQFFLSRKWLYAPLSDLEALRDALRAEIRKGLDDFEAGRTVDGRQAFRSLRKRLK
jgi:predicted RND superfamily exporter protein